MALKLLGIKVKKYYASEIDQKAIEVSMDNYADIEQIGSATEITLKKLKEIGPIDLLIGGPPCDNLSRVNHRRKKFGN